MSTTLQIGLAATGGVLLAALVAHNAWQARKNRPRQPDPSLGPEGGAHALEPGLTDAVAGTPEGVAAVPDAQTAVPADSAVGVAAAVSVPAAEAADDGVPLPVAPVPERRFLMDALLDAMAPIELDAGAVVPAEVALAALPATRRVDNKPFFIEGRNRNTQQWEPLTPGHLYDAFQAGVQLANRTGPLNEIGFSEFTLKAQAFADAVNGTPHFPDMLNEVARARELDQFAGAHDARLTFVLRARGAAWSMGYLQQAAGRQGFVPGVLPGRMVLPASVEGVPPVVSLEFDGRAAMADTIENSAIYEVLLGLEVTHVRQSERPFARMCETALQLASEMEGQIVDGNGYRISTDAMETIDRDLQGLYQTLEQHDFAAGSDLARRLFS